MYTLSEVNGKTDVVVTAMWQVTGVEGIYTANIDDSSQFALSSDVASFTPYANLTETQVISWIPKSQITSAQQCVQGQIDSMITPPVSPLSQALPW